MAGDDADEAQVAPAPPDDRHVGRPSDRPLHAVGDRRRQHVHPATALSSPQLGRHAEVGRRQGAPLGREPGPDGCRPAARRGARRTELPLSGGAGGGAGWGGVGGGLGGGVGGLLGGGRRLTSRPANVTYDVTFK